MLDALDMAVSQRKPANVIHHSDQGCQYTAYDCGQRYARTNALISMGSVVDCYDNAMCESSFATLECELIARSTFRSHRDAQAVIFDFIEGWYNPRHRHSGIDCCSPVPFEQRYHRAA